MIEKREHTNRNTVERNELYEDFLVALRDFRERDPLSVETFLLRYAGFSRKDVAIVTGCENRPETVSNRVSRVRAYLRVALKDFL